MDEIEFCPNCGNLLRLGKGEDGQSVLKCGCGYSKPYTKTSNKKNISEIQKKKLMKKTLVLEKLEGDSYPTTSIECPKCGNETAEYFQLQTRSADEPATTFYRCTKCNYRWRKY